MSKAPHVIYFRDGDHLCLFYRTIDEQLAALIPYLQLGLSRNERCFCVVPAGRSGLVADALRAAGVDVDAQTARGALVFSTPEETYFKDGSFVSEEMVRLLERNIREARDLHFASFRAAGDMGWAASDTCKCARVLEYESILNDFFKGRPALGLCMYDVSLFSADALAELMKMHRIALATPNEHTHSIRIRNGSAFGDIIFDSRDTSLFHYSIQKDGSPRLLIAGQERGLGAAWNAVESVLRSCST